MVVVVGGGKSLLLSQRSLDCCLLVITTRAAPWQWSSLNGHVSTQITLTLKCMKHGSYRWRKRLERGRSGFIFYSKPSESEEQL